MKIKLSRPLNQINTLIDLDTKTLCILLSVFLLQLPIYAFTGNDKNPHEDFFDSLLQQEITGTVTDDLGVPMAGVTVLISGTNKGASTDFDGHYSIDANAGDKLIFTYIGMEEKTITVGTSTTIDVTLEPSTSNLDEVVVVGFGSKLKRDITGSISSVGSEELEQTAFASPQFALQGNTTGVRVINASGNPNAAPQIYVRGIGSWNGNSQPLYVIDGQIITPPSAGNIDEIAGGSSQQPPNLFTMINPDDIESISVLKDASAAAVYGSRGANGVVLITTKSGKMGKPKLTYSSRVGFQNIDTWDVLNTQQYRQVVSEIYTNSLNPDITIEDDLYGRNADELTRRVTFSPQFDPESPYYIGSNATYDWDKDLVNKNAITNSHDISINGGGENSNYYIGVGYDNQESVLVGNSLESYRASVNLDVNITDWLTMGVNYKFALQSQDLEDGGSVLNFAQVAPWQPLFNANNEYGYQPVIDPLSGGGAWQPNRIYGQGSKNNYLAFKDLNRNAFKNMRNLGQAYVEIKPLEGLKIRASVNLDYITQDRITTQTYRSNVFSVVGSDPAVSSPNAPNSLGKHESRQNNIFNYQYDFTVNYIKNFGKHNLDFTAAVQDQYQTRKLQNLSSDNLTDIDPIEKIAYSNDVANNSSILGYNQRFWFGLVGRMGYNYDSRYYLDLSYRRDATSGLAKDYRWGNFYSASGAWRISGEPFMEDVEFLNDLKLRGGYGEAGSDEAIVGKFAYLSTVSDIGSYSFGSGNGNATGNYNTGVSLPNLANPTLLWEVAQTTYIGLDATLFDNRFDFTAEIYRRRQEGIQQFVNLPLSAGANPPALNIGTLENRGVDLSAGWNDKIGDFSYGIRANVSFIENEVIALYNDQAFFTQNQFGRTYYVEKGRSLGTIWGYKLGGIFQTQQEIDDFYANTPDNNVTNVDYVAPGDMYFEDVHGNPTEDEPNYTNEPDGMINANDRTDIGNSIPGYTYGLNLNAGYKNFDITLSFYGEGNVDKYNYDRAALESLGGAGNYSVSVLNRWTPSNTNTSIPRAVAGDPAGNNRFSSRFVENAAFFRLNNWQLGYTIPSKAFDSIKNAIQSVRVYVGGQNNIYITKWSGLDPVNDGYPLPRTYMLGLKASF